MPYIPAQNLKRMDHLMKEERTSQNYNIITGKDSLSSRIKV